MSKCYIVAEMNVDALRQRNCTYTPILFIGSRLVHNQPTVQKYQGINSQKWRLMLPAVMVVSMLQKNKCTRICELPELFSYKNVYHLSLYVRHFNILHIIYKT